MTRRPFLELEEPELQWALMAVVHEEDGIMLTKRNALASGFTVQHFDGMILKKQKKKEFVKNQINITPSSISY